SRRDPNQSDLCSAIYRGLPGLHLSSASKAVASRSILLAIASRAAGVALQYSHKASDILTSACVLGPGGGSQSSASSAGPRNCWIEKRRYPPSSNSSRGRFHGRLSRSILSHTCLMCSATAEGISASTRLIPTACALATSRIDLLRCQRFSAAWTQLT